MEWCRMYTLRIVVYFVMMLWWGILPGQSGIVTNAEDSSMSGRHHKLQALLKTLDAYPSKASSEGIAPAEKNYSTKSLPPTSVPSFKKSQSLQDTDERARVVLEDKSTKDFLPGSSSVKSYQDFYKVFYGTQQGVNHIRKNYGPAGLQEARSKYRGVNRELEDVRKANDHFLKIRMRAKCKVPVPTVVRVKDHYPNPSKEYLPRCTVLHRCGDTSGCCDNDAFHCIPSAMQEVTLHFYTLTVGKNGLDYIAENSIEKLLFVNHTACQCQPINDLPRMQESHHPLDGQDLPLPTQSNCRECPVPFTSRIYNDGRCGCDCFDRQKPCLRIKRGRGPLSDVERRCVEANHCHIPDCEYGLYNHRTGYCPRRHDEGHKTPHRRLPHHSQSHRWAYVERD